MADVTTLSLVDLSERSGVPGRTIREYIARGLLEGTTDRGPGASYPVEDLDRLRFVQRLRAEFGLTLDAIGGVMGQLDHAQIRRVGTGEEEVVALPLAGVAKRASGSMRRSEGRMPEGDDDVLNSEEKLPRRSRGDGGPTELKRVGIADMEEAIGRALEELTGERYAVQIDRVDFGSRRIGIARSGAASIQIDVSRRPLDGLD
jgi:DNA-binding transcriptional MerR regulator